MSGEGKSAEEIRITINRSWRSLEMIAVKTWGLLGARTFAAQF
jgi:hypothetical protein